jgi:hypothetical protein
MLAGHLLLSPASTTVAHCQGLLPALVLQPGVVAIACEHALDTLPSSLPPSLSALQEMIGMLKASGMEIGGGAGDDPEEEAVPTSLAASPAGVEGQQPQQELDGQQQEQQQGQQQEQPQGTPSQQQEQPHGSPQQQQQQEQPHGSPSQQQEQLHDSPQQQQLEQQEEAPAAADAAAKEEHLEPGLAQHVLPQEEEEEDKQGAYVY